MQPFRKKNRDAFANFLRAKYEAYTGASTVRAYPYYMVVDPSDVCQLRCPTCPTGRQNESRRTGDSTIEYRDHRAVMSPALFDALIDELGPYLFLMMFYNWGEPLLNKSLPDFIKKAHDHDIETEVHSNLSLPLSQRRIEALLASGLDSLTGSIDGFTQEAYQVHRVGGDIDRVKKNLEALAKTRDRLGLTTRIVYKMLIFRHNEHEVAMAEQYCKDIGIAFAREDAAIHEESWLPSHRIGEKPMGGTKFSIRGVSDLNGLLAFARWAEDYFSDYERANTWMPLSKDDDASYPDYCSWHYGVSVVTGSGALSPCCATAKERDDLGRVSPGRTTFADVWNNERYRHVRTVLAGESPSPAANVDTLCDHCLFPRAVYHLYGRNDVRVVSAFHRHLNETEPRLEAAFRLMSAIRYGRISQAVLRRGVFHPLVALLCGHGDERDMTDFVAFYEKYLLNEPSPFDGAGALRELPVEVRPAIRAGEAGARASPADG